MSREIKFRAYDITNKKMYDFLPLTIKHNSLEPTYWEPLLEKAQKSFDVMQFTGLLDKNGKEIYEGDLLTNESDAPLTVGWDYKFACFNAKDSNNGTDYGLLGNCEPQTYEVIGNIYENPELIKEEE